MTTQNDPAAFIREMLGQWEKFSGAGGGGMKVADIARAVQEATSSPGAAQASIRQFVERALGPADPQGRTEVEDLSVRIGRIEASLFRIEAVLAELAAGVARAAVTSPSAATTTPDA